MENDDEFLVITPDVNDNEVIIEPAKKKSKKSILNKTSKKHNLLSKIECQLKPKWNDTINTSDIGKVYDCLDITKFIENEDDPCEEMKNFQSSVNGKILDQGLLDFFRCCDGNRDYPSSKYISFSIFHPLKKCMITGSNEGVLSLFKVDGEINDAIGKPIYFERYPIKGGQLLPDGERLVIFSSRSYYKVWNLADNKISDHSISKSSKIKRLEVSPTGDYMVFSSQHSTIEVVSTASFLVVHKLQVSGDVKSMAFSHNGKYLHVFEGQGRVSVFEFKNNLFTRPVFLRHWVDHGCINAVKITISPDNEFVACGSSGIVNIYNFRDTWETEFPKPTKEIQCPDGRVNQLLFNNSSEILAIGYCLSNDMNNGRFRLIHLRSMTIFSNFPGVVGTARPTSFSFSPNDKYLAVGRFNGKVTTFNLKYYKNY